MPYLLSFFDLKKLVDVVLSMASFRDRIVLLAMRMTRLALYFSLMLLGTTLRPMNTSDLFPLFGNYICESNYSGAVLIISFAGEARRK